MQSVKDLPISAGVAYLVDGYTDYAKTVIIDRAIVGLYDGLKPVGRRILFTAKITGGDKKFIKSTRLAGNTLALHPHGDGAIYKASVPMVDKRNLYAFPLLKGAGNFGDASSGAGASAPRYTEEMLHPNAEEFFGEMDGIDMIPNFDATLQEPKELPVSFPHVLVNPSDGIAVGFSSKIPSFNFNDVLDLCIEYIEDGECSTVICPDFTTRGYYIQNNKELTKLMRVGVASLKLRGKVVVDGKKIVVTEVPFGKPVSALKKQIESKDFDSITKVGDISDFNGAGLLIECRSKAVVDKVLYDLYKETDLQYNYHAGIVVVKNGAPKQMGVWDVVSEWVEWRKGIVSKHLSAQIEGLKQKMRESNAFMTLINMTDIKNEFVERVSKSGRKSACEWLRTQITDEIPEDLFKFVSTRRLDCYYDGGEYKNSYDKAYAELKSVEGMLEDLDSYLVQQFKGLKARYGVHMQRQTEITSVDYNFTREDEEVTVDNTECVYILKDNFLKKLRYDIDVDSYDYKFTATASDTLIAFDNRGRLLRVYTQDIPVCSPSDMGVYLPRYLELLDESDDYRIMWLSVLDGSEKMLLYKDGTVGFLDTSEWLGSRRQVRVLQNGISEYAGLIREVLDEVPEVLMVIDDKGRISWTYTSDIKHKNRTARTRVFNVKSDSTLVGYCGVTTTELVVALNNSSVYQAPKVKFLEDQNDYRGSGDMFISL